MQIDMEREKEIPSSDSPRRRLLVNAKQEDEMEIEGYRLDRVRRIVIYISFFLTVGLLRLVFYWRPDWMLYCTHVPCALNVADKVLLKDQYKQLFVEDVRLSTIDGIRVLLRPRSAKLFYRKKANDLNLQESLGDTGISSGCLLRYFVNKKLKYLWSQCMDTFVKQRGLDGDISYYCENKTERIQPATCNFFHQLKSMTHFNALKLRSFYDTNAIPVRVTPAFILTLEQVFNPFYIFQVFSVILWFFEEYYYYAVCIIIISVSSIAFTVYSTRKMQRALKNTCKGWDMVTVFRDNEPTVLRSELLVPGDILEIPRGGCTMRCDAVLLNGTCIVNESMLTGESVPVMKTHLPSSGTNDVRFDIKDHSRHVIFCGTQVIQARYYANHSVKAVVIRTGYMTAKGDLVRSIMFPKPVDFRFYQDTYKFVGFLAGCAFAGMVYTIVIMVLRGEDPNDIVIKALDLVTISVPPALPAAIAVGSVMAQSRLRDKKIYCIQPSSINIAGSVNAVCFDKTGTLTEDGLDIWGFVPVQASKFKDPRNDLQDIPFGNLLYAMATCHSLTIINEKLSGDPLDIKMFEATGWNLEEPGEDTSRFDMIMPTVVRPKNVDGSAVENVSEIGIIRQFTFSSSLQRMSVIVRHLSSSSFAIYTKGSPEMIASLSLPETVPANFFEILSGYTSRGYRVIGLAFRPLLMNYTKVQKVEREDVEKDLEFLGLLVMENKLKPQTTAVIAELADANIRTIMVTGDNMLTALSVARECGLVQPRQRIVLVSALPPAGRAPAILEYHYTEKTMSKDSETTSVNGSSSLLQNIKGGSFCFAVTGKSFAVLKRYFPEVLNKVVVRGSVFARMGPDQKAQLVEILQQTGYYVGMCGDGANDCGALKAAHAGISLSEAEASIASPFTSTQPNISCVPRLVKEGRAALVTSFGIFKFIACYSLNQFISVLLLYWIGSNLTDLEFLYEDLLLISTFSITFGRTPAYRNLHIKPPLVKLTSFQPVFSLLLMTLVSAGIQVFGYFWVTMQPWFVPFDTFGEEEYKCFQNVVVYEIAIFQLIGLVIMYSRGPPYRKTLLRNFWFLANVIVAFIISTWITLYPLDFMVEILDLEVIPSIEYRAAILGIGVGSILLYFIIDMCVLEAMYFRAFLKYCKHYVCSCGDTRKAYVVTEKEFSSSGHQLPIDEDSRQDIADVLQREASYSDLAPVVDADDEVPLIPHQDNAKHKVIIPGGSLAHGSRVSPEAYANTAFSFSADNDDQILQGDDVNDVGTPM